jgi:Fe-Mn family superoxide dismutase
MEIHHGKHHAAYVAGLNTAAAGKPYLAGKSLVAILASLPEVPDEAVRTALRNHGGGHWNHTFFWEIMTAPKTDPKDGMSRHLRQAVDEAFGSLENLQTAFADAAMKRFGSGWAWLIWKDGKLKITSTANQDNPLMKGVVPDSDLGTPVLGLDVWEHAYYLHYQNRRADYVKAWWDVVNWPLLSERFAMLLLKS